MAVDKTKSGRNKYTGVGGSQGAAWWKDSHDLYIDGDGNITKDKSKVTVTQSDNPNYKTTKELVLEQMFGSRGTKPEELLSGNGKKTAEELLFGSRGTKPEELMPQSPYIYTKTESPYKQLVIPSEKITSLKESEIIDALNYYIKNREKVATGKMTQEAFDQGLLDKMGSKHGAENKLSYIDTIIDMNANVLGFDSGWNADQYTQELDESGNPTGNYIHNETTEDAGSSGLDYYENLINKSLMTDPNSDRAQQYRQSMYSSINAYEQASKASLAATELDAYRMLGQQQLQLESNIANQRMQALKSGTTSAQLASQQLASMFAAQSAAQQTAAAVMQQRATMADQYNQQRASVESDLYNLTNNNALTAANAYAQLGAAQANYNSYIQQPFAQYMAALQSAKNPYFEKAMGLENNN